MFASALERHARRIRECRRGGAHRGRVMPMEAEVDVTSAVYAEQVRSLFKQIPIALSVNFVNAALVAIVLTPLATRPFPLPWFVSVMLVTMGRGILWLHYRHGTPPFSPNTLPLSQRLQPASSLTNGLCCGLGGCRCFRTSRRFSQLFLIMRWAAALRRHDEASLRSAVQSLASRRGRLGRPMALRFFAQKLDQRQLLARHRFLLATCRWQGFALFQRKSSTRGTAARFD